MLFLLLLVLVFYFWIFTSLSCQLRYTFRQLSRFFVCFLMKKIPFNIYPFGIQFLNVAGLLLIIMLLYFWKWKSEVDYFSSFHELWLTNKKYVYLRHLTWCFDIHIHCDILLILTPQMSPSGKFLFAAECVYTHTTAFHSPISGLHWIHWFCPCTPSGWELGIEK